MGREPTAVSDEVKPAVIPRGNNLDSVRQHNLSTILGMIHHSGSISRSSLAQRSGLNRSTIAVLIGELVELDLVTESGTTSTNQVGRPSSMVFPNPLTVGIAVNPEIDAVNIGIVGLGGVVLQRIRYATERPPTVHEAVNVAAAIIEGMRGGLAAEYRIAGIGVAVPGLVRSQDGLIRLAPHLGWQDAQITTLLETATGYPVQAANDAILGARAERTFGSGIGVNDMIYLNGGASGIGGGLIVGGLALEGAGGYAGEIGHTPVRSDGCLDSANLRGTLESEVTRSALLDVLGLASADMSELETVLLASTSPAVRAEVNRQVDYLGIALGGAINLLNPQLIILGGFLGSLYAVDPMRLEAAVARTALPAPWKNVRILRPKLGDDILMVGAAELAFAHMLADPAGFVFASPLDKLKIARLDIN